MAVHPVLPNIADRIAAPASDFGSDIEIDDDTADQLFSQLESRSQSQSPVKKETVVRSIEQPQIAELEEDVYSHNFAVRLAKLQRSLHGVEESRAKLEDIVARRRREATVEVEYDERNRSTFSPANAEEPEPTTTSPESAKKSKKKDTRSPLQRFKARRPLSVTNLVSPSWCEQQYEYNLSRHGRIPQTRAMAAGTSAHKELEEQLHVEVPVEVVTREDRQGLRMWNTIQGLRALRTTGLTRELEVWGVLEEEVVNGIIDEVGVECPDAVMEARVLKEIEEGVGEKGGKGKKGPQLAPDQKTLTEYLTGSQGRGSVLENTDSSFSSFHSALLRDRPTTTYYLKDIKTTKRAQAPTHSAYTRGAHIQLMLYHRILSSLAANDVPAQQVFERYRLDGQARFSDKFVAELANLDMRAFVSVPDDADLPAGGQGRDPLGELLEFNSLERLWGLMVEEMRRTFPQSNNPSTTGAGAGAGSGVTAHASLSPLLTVEYRNPSPTSSSSNAVIGTHTFPLNPSQLSAYLKSEIPWWRGERPTVGVSVEDAWKCGGCEFGEECEWRRTRVEEGLERVRLRREGVGRSGV